MSDNRFFIRWTLSFLLVAAGVGLCYAVVDAPLARWAHQHQLRQFGIFHGLQMASDLLVILLVPALLATGWRRYRLHRFTVTDRLAWHAALAVGAVSLLKYPLKFAFGRAWPETFPPVNFPVIAYEFEAGCKFVESLAASAGNQKRSH